MYAPGWKVSHLCRRKPPLPFVVMSSRNLPRCGWSKLTWRSRSYCTFQHLVESTIQSSWWWGGGWVFLCLGDAGTFEPGEKKQTLVVAMGKLSSLFYAGNFINLQYPQRLEQDPRDVLLQKNEWTTHYFAQMKTFLWEVSVSLCCRFVCHISCRS